MIIGHQAERGVDGTVRAASLTGHEVVVGFDGSPPSEAAVRWAATEAVRLGAPLRVVYAADDAAVPRWRPRDPARTPDLVTLSGRLAARGADLARSVEPELAVHGVGAVGGAAAQLVAESAEASLVVVGRRPRGGFQAGVLGSVSFAVAMHARCPVVVVQEGGERHPAVVGAPVVVGVDGSRQSQAALMLGAEFARAWQAPLQVVSAWQVPVREPWSELLGAGPDFADIAQAAEAGAREEVAAALDLLACDHPGLDVSGRVLEGPAVDALVQVSAQAGLLVVGSRGHGGFAGMMLGSVSHAVLRGAQSPVAVVRRGSF
jgi:nucleotide-binding universal stress UspA family protein